MCELQKGKRYRIRKVYGGKEYDVVCEDILTNVYKLKYKDKGYVCINKKSFEENGTHIVVNKKQSKLCI